MSAREFSHNANNANMAMLQKELLLLKKKLETMEGASDGKCSIVSKSSMEASLFSSAARKFLGVADHSLEKDARNHLDRMEVKSKQAEQRPVFDEEMVSTSLGRLGENAGTINLTKKVDRSGYRSAFEERITLGKRSFEGSRPEISQDLSTPTKNSPSDPKDPIQIDLVDGEHPTPPRRRGRPKKGEIVESALKRKAREFYKQSFNTRRKTQKSHAPPVAPVPAIDQPIKKLKASEN